MSSDSFINLSKVKSILPSFTFRQAVTQGDGSQSFGRQTSNFNTISRSSTNVIATGSAELKGDLPSGHTSSPGDTTQPRTINVVLFGETGVGKSSVINLIARKEVAKVSSDVNGCTMQSTRYDIPFDDLNFAIFDTIGLEEPQMGVNGYLKAIEKAYELIVKLGAAGGIHLLLFCMRGGRITATTQSNYRLFCECLCSTKVPIALVFTGLEREVEMEDWWTRNKTHIEHYGIKSNGHACITAVQDDVPGEDPKYAKSQEMIRELLKSCALKNEAFLLEPHSWFAKLGKGLRSFIEKHKNPKRRDVMKVLTHRCKLDSETARKIAEMMEKGDTETKEGNQDEQAGTREGEGGSDSVVRTDKSEVAEKNTTRGDAPLNQLPDGMEVGKNAKDDAPPSQLRDGKIESRIHIDGMEVGGGSEVVKNAAKDYSSSNTLRDVQTGPPGPRIHEMEGEDRSEVAKKDAAKDYSSSKPLRDVKAGPPGPRIHEMEKDESEAAKHVEKYYAPPIQPSNIYAQPPRADGVVGKHGRRKYENRRDQPLDADVANDYAPQNQLGNVKTQPCIDRVERMDDGRPEKYEDCEDQLPGAGVAKDYTPPNQLGNAKAQSRADRVEGKFGSPPRRHEGGRHQPPVTGVAEQTRQGDTKKSSSRPRHSINYGSQS